MLVGLHFWNFLQVLDCHFTSGAVDQALSEWLTTGEIQWICTRSPWHTWRISEVPCQWIVSAGGSTAALSCNKHLMSFIPRTTFPGFTSRNFWTWLLRVRREQPPLSWRASIPRAAAASAGAHTSLPFPWLELCIPSHSCEKLGLAVHPLGKTDPLSSLCPAGTGRGGWEEGRRLSGDRGCGPCLDDPSSHVENYR